MTHARSLGLFFFNLGGWVGPDIYWICNENYYIIIEFNDLSSSSSSSLMASDVTNWSFSSSCFCFVWFWICASHPAHFLSLSLFVPVFLYGLKRSDVDFNISTSATSVNGLATSADDVSLLFYQLHTATRKLLLLSYYYADCWCFSIDQLTSQLDLCWLHSNVPPVIRINSTTKLRCSMPAACSVSVFCASDRWCAFAGWKIRPNLCPSPLPE